MTKTGNSVAASLLHCCLMLILAYAVWSCNSSGEISGVQGPAEIETKEDGEIFITDETGKRWEVSHAKNKYGLDPKKFQFGLGPDAIPPIMNPEMIRPGDPEYPDDDATFLVMGAELNNDPRAYPIIVMAQFEVANDQFGEDHVAVAY